MIQLRKSGERGCTRTDWLESYHSFSFNNYYDPHHIRYGPLRVLNEDVVQAGRGFPRHAHQNMEIITYVLSGALKHEDSAGGEGIIRAGEAQKMSAGSGIVHSEYNGSDTEPVHFIQIWLMPRQTNIAPYYEQKALNGNGVMNQWLLLAGPDASEHSLMIHQDAGIYKLHLTLGASVSYDTRPDRKYYLFVINGSVETNGVLAGPGDALMLTELNGCRITARALSHILWFDLPING